VKDRSRLVCGGSGGCGEELLSASADAIHSLAEQCATALSVPYRAVWRPVFPALTATNSDNNNANDTFAPAVAAPSAWEMKKSALRAAVAPLRPVFDVAHETSVDLDESLGDALLVEQDVDLGADLDADLGAAASSGASAADREYHASHPWQAREYQVEAAGRVAAELASAGRCVLAMACRTGKTPVAFQVSLAYRRVLFLVPGLALARQTAMKLFAYAVGSGLVERPPEMLVVGSSPGLVKVGRDVELAMTTDPAEVARFLDRHQGRPGARCVIVSTYQSSDLVPADFADLVVFDEAHRVCGPVGPRAFNHHALSPKPEGQHRLFMTATPAYETPLSMADRSTFGGVAYKYHLRRGIDAGTVHPFGLELLEYDAADADDAGLAGLVHRAMARPEVRKLLVFCRSIRHAETLCELTRGLSRGGYGCLVAHSRQAPAAVAGALRELTHAPGKTVLFNCRLLQEGVEVPALNAVLFASPRNSPRDIIQSLCRPLNALPGKPESTVFLPVRQDPSKPASHPDNLGRFAPIVPFVDALLADDPKFYEHLLNPSAAPYPLRGSSDAVLDGLYRAARYGTSSGTSRSSNRLLRNRKIPWPVGFGEIRRVVKDCSRYPKTGELFVVVAGAAAEEHGTARLDSYYQWCRKHWLLAERGLESELEPYQCRDLESLPFWRTFGAHGPYHWDHCIAVLERWLEENGGVPPMLEIHKGGFIGLDATDLERLAGAMMTVNTGDGSARQPPAAAGGAASAGAGGGSDDTLDITGRAPRGSGFTIPRRQQVDLDRICEKYGLTWRKQRGPDGAILKGQPRTFIQDAYARFMAHYKEHGKDSAYIQTHFPGYPTKTHDHPDAKELGLLPKRRAPTTQRARRERTPWFQDEQ
jgi:superfamily II DNA or RNA helicase